jgi:DNA-binding response OmpR family regulator
MYAPISILLFGHNARLLETQKMVLEPERHRVYMAVDLSTAKRVLREKQVDLLILCHSLSMEERGRVSRSPTAGR